MNAQSFLDNFRTIARAPGGISRVRDLVYFFAITGGLSRPEAGDSDANLILDDSFLAKLDYYDENSVRQGARKHTDIFQVVKRVPSHWVMVAAGDLVHLINGRAFKAADWKNSGLPIIRIQNLNNPTAPFNFFQGEVAEGHRVRTGDMLLSWSGTPGTSFGAFIWNGGDAVLNQHIFKVAIYSSQISKEYLRMAINASLDALIGSARGGVGLKHVTKGQIESLQIPLPPLEEQNRIVAKVDELMRLCDWLEAQQQERQKLLPLLSRASHARFIAKPTPANLEAIFYRLDSVCLEDLKATILTLAVRGQLVSQVADDDALVDSFKGLDVDNQTATAGQLPPHWIRVKYRNLTSLITSGSRSWKQYYASSGAVFIRTQNIKTDVLLLDDVAYVRLPPTTEGKRTQVMGGDILVTITGANVNKAALVTEPIPEAYVSQHIALTRPQWRAMAEWLHLCFVSPGAVRGDLDRLVYGDKPGLNLDSIRELAIPLPPLAEQRKIVAKVSEMLRMCDRLEVQGRESKQTAESFAKAAIAAITSTEFTENERMKPPKTEVVTALKVGRKPKKPDAAPLATLLSEQKAEASAKTLWQLSGLEIDTFYRQLKTEMANGWIDEDNDKRAVHEVEDR